MSRCFVSALACVMIPASCLAQDAPAPGKLAPGKQVEMRMQDAEGDFGYLLYLPRAYDEDKGKAWPLVLFLHGRGESYGPLELVTKWGPPRFAQRGDDLPFVLVSPQCPAEGRWSDDVRLRQLERLLTALAQAYRIDGDRVYLTGLSMGGYGSWSLAARNPERFAAVAPICGGGDPGSANKLVSLPIWVFHGDQDGAVPFRKSVEMVEAIRAAGGTKIRFTSLEHVGHNSWSAAYATPELFDWMLKQAAAADK